MNYIDRCRDTTPPVEDRPFEFDHPVFFAGKSKIWGGKGKAFLDVEKDGHAFGRTYMITRDQYAEVKEMEGSDYRRKVDLGELDGIPVVTFTHDKRPNPERSVPSPEYLDIILDGLKETYAEYRESALAEELIKGIFSDEEISLGNRVVRHHIDIDWSRHFIGDRLSVWRMALRHRTITMGSRSGLQSFPLDGICQRKQTEHQYYGAGDPHSTHTNDMEDITIKEAQEAVDRWIKTYGVRYFSELTNMAVLTEEVGELARIMARKYGDQSFKPGEKDDLGDEMADVLWVLICLANQTGVDLTEELKKNLGKKTKRDKERHINNQKLK